MGLAGTVASDAGVGGQFGPHRSSGRESGCGRESESESGWSECECGREAGAGARAGASGLGRQRLGERVGALELGDSACGRRIGALRGQAEREMRRGDPVAALRYYCPIKMAPGCPSAC